MRVLTHFFIVILLISFTKDSFGCTTFALDQPVVAKSFDWDEHQGMIVVNKKNVSKTALRLFATDDPKSWRSFHGSVSFNQHGRGFPLGGMNDKGLIVEIMVGPSEDIPANDPRKSLNELQWIQFVLDSYASVDEMIRGHAEQESIHSVRVARGVINVHYMVCDRHSECAAVEYLDHDVQISRSSDSNQKVFTNDSYRDSMGFLERHVGFGGREPIPTDDSSLSRFTRAASWLAGFSEGSDPSAYAWWMLGQLRSAGGQWQTVYLPGVGAEIAVAEVAGKKTYRLDQLDFSCSTPVQVLDLESNVSGNIQDHLQDYSEEINAAMIDQSTKPPEAVKGLLKAYPSTTRCLD